jgi:hypothetical protein
MKDSADTLPRRVALYRRYLKEGVEINLARVYLDEIAKAEAALRELENQSPNSQT